MQNVRHVWQGLKERLASRHLRIGDLLRQTGQLDAAINAYRQALQLNPVCTAACHNLAGVLGELNRWDEAARTYQQVVSMEPGFLQAYAGWVDCLSQKKDWQGVLSVVEQLQQLSPEAYQPYDWQADSLMRLGRVDEAIAAYQQVILRRPRDSSAQQKLGQALRNKQAWQAAAEAFRTAIELKPNNCPSLDALGDCLSQLQDWEAAADCYTRARDLDPQNHWHSFKLAGLYQQTGDWNRAEEALLQCQQLAPDLAGLSDLIEIARQQQSQAEQLRDYCSGIKARAHAGTRPADDRLRILLLTPFAPYPPTGGAIRLFEEIKYFGQRHDLVVASFYSKNVGPAIRQALEDYCEFVLLVNQDHSRGFDHPVLPQLISNWQRPYMTSCLQQLAETGFDLVLFNFHHISSFLPLFETSYTVIEEHNIESELYRQIHGTALDSAPPLNTADEIDRIRRHEESIWPRFSLCTTVSEHDQQQIVSRCPEAETLVVQNGVDTRTVVPVQFNPEGNILFTGHLSYAPNIDAVTYIVNEILPLLWQQDEHIGVTIAGRNPTTSLYRLCEDERIQVIANPEDMREVAENCSVSIVPLRMGSGTRLKILEAFSMALPVVSTTLGCEGLNVVHDEHLLVHDHPQDFANAILQLRSDSRLSTRLRMNGRRLVKNEYDWTSIFAHYEQTLLSRIREPSA